MRSKDIWVRDEFGQAHVIPIPSEINIDLENPTERELAVAYDIVERGLSAMD